MANRSKQHSFSTGQKTRTNSKVYPVEIASPNEKRSVDPSPNLDRRALLVLSSVKGSVSREELQHRESIMSSSSEGRSSGSSSPLSEVTSDITSDMKSELTSEDLTQGVELGDSTVEVADDNIEKSDKQMSDSVDDRRSLTEADRIPKLKTKGQLVTFYRNGDSHSKGYETSVGRQYFSSLITLKNFLSEKIKLDKGSIKYILALPFGEVVKDLGEFVAGRGYVVSSTPKLIDCDYLNAKEKHWDIRQPSGGRSKFRHEKGRVDRGPPVNRKPRVLLIASNSNRESIRKFYLNEKTPQLYEEFLKDVQSSLDLPRPPITGLFTASPRHRKVKSYSHLQRELKSVSEFLACGKELYPDITAPYPRFKELRNQEQHEPQRRTRGPNAQSQDDEGASGQGVGSRHQGNEDTIDSRERYGDGVKRDVSGDPTDDVRNNVDRNRYKTHIISKETATTQGNEAGSTSDVSTPGSSRSVSTQTSAEGELLALRGQPAAQNLLSVHQREDGTPDKDVVLEWVYGYRGRDTVNSLRMLPDGRLVFYVGAVVVLLDRKSDQQTHYTEHTEDVTCLSTRADGPRSLVVSGQLHGRGPARAAHIRVWDAVTLETLGVVGQSVLGASICAVGFPESDGTEDIVLTVDESPNHVIRILDWRQNKVLAKTTNCPDTVVWGSFHPLDSSVLVTLGRRHLYFWKLLLPQEADDIGQILRDTQSGVFPPDETPEFVTSVEFAPTGDVITGDSEGRMCLWSRDDLQSPFAASRRCSDQFRRAHKGPIFALCMLEDGLLLSAADNTLKVWNVADDYSPIQEVKVPSLEGSIRTLTPQLGGGVDRTLYLGTTGNDVLEGTLRTHFEVIIEGHHDELFAVTSIPGEAHFLTLGLDCEVRKWDGENHRCDWVIKMDKPCTAVAVDNLGRHVALGTPEGRVIVMRTHDGRHVTSVQVATGEITAMKYSPDNNFLAMGCSNRNIYVYSVHDKGTVYRKYLYGVLQGHTGAVSQLDWSCDGRHLQSMAGNNYLYWCVTNLSSVESDTSRHIDWFTHTCVGGHSFTGGSGEVREDASLLCTDRATSDDVMVVGDRRGMLRVYRYLADTPGTPEAHRKQGSQQHGGQTTVQPQKYHAHRVNSGQVSGVCFLYGDSHVISVGGLEGCIFQWRVVDV